MQLEMENEGTMPSVVTYHAMIRRLFESRDMAQIKFVEMWAVGLLPYLITYSSALNGYCKEGNLVS